MKLECTLKLVRGVEKQCTSITAALDFCLLLLGEFAICNRAGFPALFKFAGARLCYRYNKDLLAVSVILHPSAGTLV
jgi:hypothetical protein